MGDWNAIDVDALLAELLVALPDHQKPPRWPVELAGPKPNTNAGPFPKFIPLPWRLLHTGSSLLPRAAGLISTPVASQ